MRKPGKRAWFAISLGVLAVPLVATAIAYACTAVATLTTNPGAAPAGSTIMVNGTGFGTHNGAADDSGPAEIRIGSVTGPVLATAMPTTTKKTFSVAVTIPAGTPVGDTFIAATEREADGTPVYGTPARQAFTVTAPAARTATTQSSSGLTASGPSNTNTSTSTVTKTKSTASIAKAVAKCKSKYNPSKAKSKKGKKSSAAKRAACIKKAKA